MPKAHTHTHAHSNREGISLIPQQTPSLLLMSNVHNSPTISYHMQRECQQDGREGGWGGL